MRKLNDLAQMNAMMMYLIVLVIMMFILSDSNTVAFIATTFNSFLYPLIGFGGVFPVLTIICAGLIVTFLSSFFNVLFSDWKKMAESQEIQKAFSAEMRKAQKEGNTNRMNKLKKMQPEMMKKQQDASSGAMKPMIILMIFIVPIFIWLRFFLGSLDYYFFTVPWAKSVSFFDRAFYMQSWFLMYMVFSFVVGAVIRYILRYIRWSDWWKNLRGKNNPSRS